MPVVITTENQIQYWTRNLGHVERSVNVFESQNVRKLLSKVFAIECSVIESKNFIHGHQME